MRRRHGEVTGVLRDVPRGTTWPSVPEDIDLRTTDRGSTVSIGDLKSAKVDAFLGLTAPL
jgi:hypothetical protein